MNKTEKLICLLLGAVLAWYIFVRLPKQSQAAADAAKAQPRQTAAARAVANRGDAAAPAAAQADANGGDRSAAPAAAARAVPSEPEETVVLENDDLRLELSSWGAVVKRATLKGYARDRGAISEANPAVTLDFASAPLGELGGADGLGTDTAYAVRKVDDRTVVFTGAKVTRTVTLGEDFQVAYADAFKDGAAAEPMTMSVGAMRMGGSKNDLLSVDSMVKTPKGDEVVHHCEGDSPLKDYLVGGLSGGCSGSKDAKGQPASVDRSVQGAQEWVAVKNRFFVTALAGSSEANEGFDATIARDVRSANYRPSEVAVRVRFAASAAGTRTSVFYVGPKKQSLLWNLGMRDVMEFGMWRWICYPLVWVLNFFNGLIPNYGVAIILLTILVRLLFWPLTHKSTVGMKKMQELQPKMKEIQAKYKDNPQRLQQEMWSMYREAKVNPMSSCLPMLIQIPVFIALFNVLRSAVELRYAPFLWIADLSEPEGLFASWFPFGGLNVLPILMAVSTGLQSAFTPSTGDKSQQRMMMVFMPAMMLFMFYSFPSALSLYWFLSNLFSIVQMWLIRRQAAAARGAVVPEVIDPPQTRQMRRHGG